MSRDVIALARKCIHNPGKALDLARTVAENEGNIDPRDARSEQRWLLLLLLLVAWRKTKSCDEI